MQICSAWFLDTGDSAVIASDTATMFTELIFLADYTYREVSKNRIFHIDHKDYLKAQLFGR